MIEKRRSFADKVLRANKKAVSKACNLEKELMALAFKFSLYPELGSVCDYELHNTFRILKIKGRVPDLQECGRFVEASLYGYRVESSLMSDIGQVTLAPVGMPLVLRVKFYHKKDREEYFAITIVFNDEGDIDSWSI